MKVGMIFECGLDGPDYKVCKHLASLVAPAVVIKPAFLDTKRNFFLNPPVDNEERDVARVARGLLEIDRCEKVMLIWDLSPKEFQTCVDECEFLKNRLRAEGVDEDRVVLICITQMLETWLITDANAVMDGGGVSKNHRDKKEMLFSSPKKPEREHDPKAMLKSYYKKVMGRGADYRDTDHAIRIAQKMDRGLAKLRKVPSFKRFEERLQP